jgi:hypothetical protein
MTSQELPHLEPEDQEIEAQGDLESTPAFEDHELDEFMLDTPGELALEELDDLDEFSDPVLPDPTLIERPQEQRRPPGNLASLAAHIALKWSGQASTSLPRSKGRRSGAMGALHELAELFEEDEWEEFESPVRASQTCSAALLEDDELVQALATAATEAHSKGEAARLIAATVPLALRRAPDVYRALWPALPALIQGTVGVTRLLHSRSATRPLVAELLPPILRGTVAHLAQYARHNQSITRRLAAKVLARQTAAILRRRQVSRRPSRRRSWRSSYEQDPSEWWWNNGRDS